MDEHCSSNSVHSRHAEHNVQRTALFYAAVLDICNCLVTRVVCGVWITVYVLLGHAATTCTTQL